MTILELLQDSNVLAGEVVGTTAIMMYRAVFPGRCQYCSQTYTAGRRIIGLHAEHDNEGFNAEVSMIVCSKGCAYAQIVAGLVEQDGL